MQLATRIRSLRHVGRSSASSLPPAAAPSRRRSGCAIGSSPASWGSLGRHGRDEDMFDAWCEHLVVRDNPSDEIVGTYRILTPDGARRSDSSIRRATSTSSGSPRSSRESPKSAAAAFIRDSGRARQSCCCGRASPASCASGNLRYLTGCASIGMQDGGSNAIRVYDHLVRRHLAPIEYPVHRATR